MLLYLAQFYILINIANTIVKSYQNLNNNKHNVPLDYSLVKDVAYQGLKGVSNIKPKFFLIQTILYRSFRSRVVALVIEEITSRRLLNVVNAESEDRRIDTIKKAIKALKLQQYLDVLTAIYKKAFSQEAYASKGADPTFTTICRMLVQVEQFITIRRSIRYIDISYLRRIVDYLIPIFFSTNQNNYGREMLYLQSLLNNTIIDLLLQRAILLTSLVNLSRRRSKAVASNEMLELYNLDYAINYKVNANSTYNIAATFRKVVLNRESNQKHRKMFESGISIEGSNSYSHKDNTIDIFSQGNKLFIDRLIKQVLGRKGAVSTNIAITSTTLFIEKVEALNIANNRIAKGIGYLVQIERLDDPLDNVDAEERRNYSTDRRNIVDAIIDIEADKEYTIRARNRLTITIDSIDSLDTIASADREVSRSASINQQMQGVLAAVTSSSRQQLSSRRTLPLILQYIQSGISFIIIVVRFSLSLPRAEVIQFT